MKKAASGGLAAFGVGDLFSLYDDRARTSANGFG
jgi:hypothetical protein